VSQDPGLLNIVEEICRESGGNVAGNVKFGQHLADALWVKLETRTGEDFGILGEDAFIVTNLTLFEASAAAQRSICRAY
jgi:hypothetical protein